VEQLFKNLAWKKGSSAEDATQTAARPDVSIGRNVVVFGGVPRVETLSVRDSLSGKHLMLIGVTGFIGKVWLVELLQQVPNIRKITLLIRRNRTTTAQRRFEKIVEESPTLDPLQEIHGRGLGQFLKEKLEVVEGDVSAPKLGLDAATHDRLAKSLDVVVNSAGLTDFNPDLREALSSNDVTSREMHQRGMIGRAQKLDEVKRRIDVGRKRLA
jgi:nucleoside-diphosphate-sugar epimerase